MTRKYLGLPHHGASLVERFIAKVEKTETCWIWLGARHHSAGGMRYGGFSMGYHEDGRQYNTTAHRAAWLLFRGPLPKGQSVDHLCMNPICVNPDHLEPVPQNLNVYRGRRNHYVLSEWDVRSALATSADPKAIAAHLNDLLRNRRLSEPAA